MQNNNKKRERKILLVVLALLKIFLSSSLPSFLFLSIFARSQRKILQSPQNNWRVNRYTAYPFGPCKFMRRNNFLFDGLSLFGFFVCFLSDLANGQRVTFSKFAVLMLMSDTSCFHFFSKFYISLFK